MWEFISVYLLKSTLFYHYRVTYSLGVHVVLTDLGFFSASLSFVAAVWSDAAHVRIVSAHLLHRLWWQVCIAAHDAIALLTHIYFIYLFIM